MVAVTSINIFLFGDAIDIFSWWWQRRTTSNENPAAYIFVLGRLAKFSSTISLKEPYVSMFDMYLHNPTELTVCFWWNLHIIPAYWKVTALSFFTCSVLNYVDANSSGLTSKDILTWVFHVQNSKSVQIIGQACKYYIAMIYTRRFHIAIHVRKSRPRHLWSLSFTSGNITELIPSF